MTAAALATGNGATPKAWAIIMAGGTTITMADTTTITDNYCGVRRLSSRLIAAPGRPYCFA
jgi:hypothetical protein